MPESKRAQSSSEQDHDAGHSAVEDLLACAPSDMNAVLARARQIANSTDHVSAELRTLLHLPPPASLAGANILTRTLTDKASAPGLDNEKSTDSTPGAPEPPSTSSEPVGAHRSPIAAAETLEPQESAPPAPETQLAADDQPLLPLTMPQPSDNLAAAYAAAANATTTKTSFVALDCDHDELTAVDAAPVVDDSGLEADEYPLAADGLLDDGEFSPADDAAFEEATTPFDVNSLPPGHAAHPESSQLEVAVLEADALIDVGVEALNRSIMRPPDDAPGLDSFADPPESSPLAQVVDHGAGANDGSWVDTPNSQVVDDSLKGNGGQQDVAAVELDDGDFEVIEETDVDDHRAQAKRPPPRPPQAPGARQDDKPGLLKRVFRSHK